jgi:ligand-binding sensor domain-containing protein/two-component sensor histidine kinase
LYFGYHMRFCTPILFFIWINTLAIYGQVGDYRFVNFNAKDGLDEKFIYNATQDKQGYMWFGTANGLYRYDGHRFNKFRSPLDKSGDAISNVLQAIMTDKDGTIWLGSFSSLQCYNPTKNIFWKPIAGNSAQGRINADYILSFSEGKYVWIATAKNYCYRFNKADSTVLSLANRFPPGASKRTIQAIEANGKLYAVHREGIYIFDISGAYITRVAHPPADISNCHYAASENALYFSTLSSGVLKFDLVAAQWVFLSAKNDFLKKNNLLCIAQKNNGDLFIGGYPLFVLNTRQNKLLNFFGTQNKDEFSLNCTKIAGFFLDRENNLWICSHFGLSMLPWQNSQVKNIVLQDNKTGWTIEPMSIVKDTIADRLLLATTNASGLLYLNEKQGQTGVIPNPLQSNPLKKRITTLVPAPGGEMYASDGEHFFKYNPIARSLSRIALTDQYGKPIATTGRNVCTAAGKIYLATQENGFYIWDYYAHTLTHFSKKDVVADAKDNRLVPCLVDSRQNVWFTSTDGIVEHRLADGKFYKHSNNGNATVPQLEETVYIAEDKQGHYWIATYSNGLYEMYTQQQHTVWRNYSVKDAIGLPSDYNNKIVLNPADGLLWINNTVGLLRFDPVQKKVLSIIDKQNGFALDGSGYGFSLLPDNRLVQQLYGHASLIDLNTYSWSSKAPDVVFNAVKVMSEDVGITVATKGELYLQHNQNFIEFDFAALLYNNANRNQYAYWLEGADTGWVYCGQQHTAAYAALKYGIYLFKVKAANCDAVWGNVKTIKVVIQPPFYLRWWFIIFVLLFFFLLFFWWNKKKINAALKEEQMKLGFQQQLSEMEMKALRAQMNPHFIFNSLNSIQKYILQNDQFAASQYLTKFSRLIRLILDHSNQSEILLSSELDLLRLYIEMECLRFEDKFNYTLHVQPGMNAETVSIPSMLIQPYVENAIWHGLLHKVTKGNLQVNFSKKEEGVLQVIIEDDGIGRAKAAELKSKQVLRKKSYGMQITADRIMLINRTQNIKTTCEIQDLTDADGAAAGTKIILLIPLQSINE